jgi:hypothetical protein
MCHNATSTSGHCTAVCALDLQESAITRLDRSRCHSVVWNTIRAPCDCSKDGTIDKDASLRKKVNKYQETYVSHHANVSLAHSLVESAVSNSKSCKIPV